MKDLRQIEQEVEDLRAKVKEARKAEKDVNRLIGWLEFLVNEAEDYRNLPWYDKTKLGQSHHFFFKGQTRQGREIAKRFLRWKVGRRSAAEVNEQAGELLGEVRDAIETQDSRDAAERWEAALEIFAG